MESSGSRHDLAPSTLPLASGSVRKIARHAWPEHPEVCPIDPSGGMTDEQKLMPGILSAKGSASRWHHQP
jgi:hypothetical protein